MLTPLFEVNTLGVSLVAWGSFKKKTWLLGDFVEPYSEVRVESVAGGLFARLKEAERELAIARDKPLVVDEHAAV